MDLKLIAEAYQSVQEKKLDPVGKEDGDVDNDGDKDSSDSYLMKRRAAIKKAMKKEEVEKEETEHNYVNAYLDELKKTTMGSYIAKASKDLADRRFDQGDSEKRKYDPDEADEKEDKKLDKREQGIARAAKKITKEHHQKDADGKVIEHEDVAPSSVEEEKTVLEQLAENNRDIDTFEAVISYLIDEGFAESWEEAQDIMVTLKPELVEEVYQNQLIESEKLASKAYERAKTLGARRRSSYEYRKKGSFGPGKNERAGYNLSQSQQSRNTSPATQSGPQTGGGPKSFGFARNKSNPVKSKSVGDTGGIGHQKKADTKITTKKDGKTPLKTPRYKYSTKQRDQMGFYGRMEKRDPKKNPKHEANKKK